MMMMRNKMSFLAATALFLFTGSPLMAGVGTGTRTRVLAGATQPSNLRIDDVIGGGDADESDLETLASKLKKLEASHGKTNVLFIMADDLVPILGTYHDAAVSGGPGTIPHSAVAEGARVSTPNLDALAARGVRFDRVYTQYPVCASSRPSMMNSLYPASMGQRPSTHKTMPQVFLANGYKTTRMGKIYHMGVPGGIQGGGHGSDNAADWTERYSFKAGEHEMTSVVPGVTYELTHYMSPSHHRGSNFQEIRVTEPEDEALLHDTQVTEKALDWLETNQNTPFFLALGYIRPHVPMVAPSRFFDLYPHEQMVLPHVPVGDLNDLVDVSQTNNVKYHMSEPQQRGATSGYFATISYLDYEIGRVLDKLEALGLADNTIVVFVSDHGYHLGEHTMWQKLSLHEESTRVPMLMAGPGISDQGQGAAGLMEMVDIYPTLVDMCGLSLISPIEGQSMRAVLEDPTKPGRHSAYTNTHNNGRTLRTDRYRIIRFGNGYEFYDLHADPSETNSLVYDPAYRIDFQMMRELLAIREAGTLSLPVACYADLDQSTGVGVLDVFDFLAFQDLFVTGDPYACNLDLSTGPNLCDIFDFLAFQSEFVAGCN